MAFKYLSNPNIIFTLIYLGVTGYSHDFTILFSGPQDNPKWSKEFEKAVVFVLIVLMLVFDLFL